MTIIMFSSKSGSSEWYARALASRTGLDVFPASDHPDGEDMVFFGWLRNDVVVGIGDVDPSRLLAVCVVGLDDVKKFPKREIADRNGIHVPIYYMRGWIDRKRLNPLDKAVLLAVCVMMKLKGLDPKDEPVFDAMMNGGSFVDDKYLEPVELFLGSRR